MPYRLNLGEVVLLFMGLILVFVEIGAESFFANFQDRWFLPIVLTGLALTEFTKRIRERLGRA